MQLHIKDVHGVKVSYKREGSRTLLNGEPSVDISLLKNSDAITVDVANAIDTSIDELKAQLHVRAELTTDIETSECIEESFSSLTQNLLIGGVISVFILLLFLKSVRATIVIALSIPIAIISTFSLMYFTGETLNVLTLGGLALGLGMMVDSSIV